MRQPTPARRRLLLLLGTLLAAAVALPVTRYALDRKPPEPDSSASVSTQRRYWQERIARDISDTQAFVKLGVVEERAGFFLAARRALFTARALGAPDSEISAPLGRALSQLALEDDARPELEKAVALAPNSLPAHLNLAGFHVAARRLSEARKVLATFAETHAETLSSEERERLALAFLTCGDEASSLKLCREVLETSPDSPSALSLAARGAFATGDLAFAARCMESLEDQAPNDPLSLYFHGLILQRQKKYDDALAAWQKANALNPDAFDVYERIGEEYARRKDFARAAVAMEKVASLDQNPAAAHRAAEAYRRSGAPLDAAYWDAVAAGLNGDFENALVFAKLARNTPDAARRRRGLSALAEGYRGLKKNKEYLAAIDELTKAGTPDDLLLRARAFEHTENFPKRLETLLELAQKSPDRAVATRLDIADLLRRMGRRDEAEKIVEEGLSTDPENVDLLRQLASFYLDRRALGDRLQKATRLCERLVVKTPDDEVAWLQLGQCYAAKNDFPRAARALEHVIDLEPGYGPGYQELSRVYARKGDTQGAAEMLKLYQKYVAFEQEHQTLQTRARRPKAERKDIIAFGDFLLKIGDLNGATAWYERALAAEPGDLPTRRLLQTIYRRQGKTERADALAASLPILPALNIPGVAR